MKSLYKIVHTSAAVRWGGTEKRILDESLWMMEQGHQVVVIAPPHSPLLAKARVNGLSCYALSFRGFFLSAQLTQLREILANEQPHIINAHGSKDGRLSLKAAKKVGVPCRIMSYHGREPVRNSWLGKKLFRRLSHYAFATSARTASLLKKTFNLKDLEVFSISPGIALPGHLPSQEEARQRLAKDLDLEPDALFIGLLDVCNSRQAIAHVSHVLEAFKHIHRSIPHHLIIPTADDFLPTLLKANEKLGPLSGRVHIVPPWTPWIYFRALSCAVHVPAAEWEGVPRAMLEAMHAACPVVSGRTDEIEEMAEHGTMALLWDMTQPEQMADAVMDTLKRANETQERVLQAREKIARAHTIDIMGRDIIRIYRLHQVKLERRYYKVEPELD